MKLDINNCASVTITQDEINTMIMEKAISLFIKEGVPAINSDIKLVSTSSGVIVEYRQNKEVHTKPKVGVSGVPSVSKKINLF